MEEEHTVTSEQPNDNGTAKPTLSKRLSSFWQNRRQSRSNESSIGEEPSPSSIRPHLISVTCYKEEQGERWGIGLGPVPGAIPGRKRVAIIATASPAEGVSYLLSPLIHRQSQDDEQEGDADSQPPFLQQGDILRSIQGVRVRNTEVALEQLTAFQQERVTIQFEAAKCVSQKAAQPSPVEESLVEEENAASSDDHVEAQPPASASPALPHPDVLQAFVQVSAIPATQSESEESSILELLGLELQSQVLSAAPQSMDSSVSEDGVLNTAESGEEEVASRTEIPPKDDPNLVENGDQKESAQSEPEIVVTEASTESEPADEDQPTEFPTTTALTIQSITESSLLKHSGLQPGDVLVTSNGLPVRDWSVEKFQEHLEQSLEAHRIKQEGSDQQTAQQQSFWNLVVVRPRIRRSAWQQAKRVGVAVGGGAMVGVGLIFIPTLPPPFGEVLIVGGVSWLGTEFEGPKRVMRKARDSVHNWAHLPESEDQENNGDDTEEDSDAVVGESDVSTSEEKSMPVEATSEATAENSEVSSSKVLSRTSSTTSATDNNSKPKKDHALRRFSRNVLVPFLDQVVGDGAHAKPVASQTPEVASQQNVPPAGSEDTAKAESSS